MSESMLSSIRAYSWQQDAAMPASGREAKVQVAGDTEVHFQDFLQGVNVQSEQEFGKTVELVDEQLEAEVEPVANLTAKDDHRQIGDAALKPEVSAPSASRGLIEQLYAPTKSPRVMDQSAWTFVAPTVQAALPPSVVTAGLDFQIYAKSRDDAVKIAPLQGGGVVDIRR